MITSFQVMRPQHGVEFAMKELNATSWNVGETPQVSIFVYKHI
jgi:protein deglycase